MLAFSTHGGQIPNHEQAPTGRIVSKNAIMAKDKFINIELIITKLSNCSSLAGKPKLFFFQVRTI